MKRTEKIKREKLESADSMIPNPMGVVQFNSFEDTRVKIKQTGAGRIWLLNVVSNFVGLRATEPFKVMQFVRVGLDMCSQVPVEEPGSDRRLKAKQSPHSLPVIGSKCIQ